MSQSQTTRASQDYWRPRNPCPNNNMGMAAISLLGAWPLAIVAIFYANSVRSKWDAGDRSAAYTAADRARGWAIASWCVGAVTLIFLLSVT